MKSTQQMPAETSPSGNRYGLSVARQTELIELWNTSGWSEDAIAAHFGFCRAILSRWKHRLGLEKRQPYPPNVVIRKDAP